MATESFKKAISRRGVQPRLRFVHNGTNYDEYVIKVSRVKRDANLTAGVATVTLNNGTGTFNFWKDTTTALYESAQVKVYVSGAASDLFTLFSGKVKGVEYVGSRVIVHIRDHMADMFDKPMGTGRAAKLYTTQGQNPDLLVWRILSESSNGGLDPTQNTSNTDIDWTSFAAWRDNYLSTKQYILRAKFTSQKVRWALLKIAQLTHSYIFVNTDGKMAFAPSLGTGLVYDETNCRPIDLKLSTDNMITRILLRYGFDIVQDDWGGTTGYYIAGDSEPQYGRISYDEESRVIWHSTVGSAAEDAAQTLTDLKFPVKMFSITTNLAGMTEEIGNEITVSDTLKSISNATAVVEEIITDMEARKVMLKARWAW